MKISWSYLFDAVKTAFRERKSDICTVTGLTMMWTAGVTAVVLTPKAMQLVDEKKKELDVDKLTPAEFAAATWRIYTGPLVGAAAGTALVVYSDHEDAKQIAALTAAYAMTNADFKDYKEKVVDEIGEKKEKAIEDRIAADKLAKAPVVTANNVIATGYGSTLCYDAMFGRYFYSDIEKLRKAENVINQMINHKGCASLNDFFEEINLAPIYPLGDNLGWNIDKDLLSLDFSAQIAENNEPCVVIRYKTSPYYDFI